MQLEKLSNVKQPVFIAGDFNCPNVNWTTFEAPRDSVQNVLAEFICAAGFTQLVNWPTCKNNILDLVLSQRAFAYIGYKV